MHCSVSLLDRVGWDQGLSREGTKLIFSLLLSFSFLSDMGFRSSLLGDKERENKEKKKKKQKWKDGRAGSCRNLTVEVKGINRKIINRYSRFSFSSCQLQPLGFLSLCFSAGFF